MVTGTVESDDATSQMCPFINLGLAAKERYCGYWLQLRPTVPPDGKDMQGSSE